MFSPRPVRRLAVAVAALVLLGACGGDGDEASDSTAGVTATEPTVAVGAGSTAAPNTTSASPSSAVASTGGSTASSGAAADIDAYVEAGTERVGTDNEEAAMCFASSLIDGIGADRVLATGLSPEEFFASASLEEAGVTITDEIRADVEANVLGCGDLVEIIAESVDDETDAECLRQTFTNELIAERFAVAVVGATPSPELEEAQALIQACGNP